MLLFVRKGYYQTVQSQIASIGNHSTQSLLLQSGLRCKVEIGLGGEELRCLAPK